MEVSMLRLAWLTITQHVFQPALTGRLELILRKIVSCEPGTKAIAVSRSHEKVSPADWVQGVTAISRKIPCSWAPRNGVQHATAIYPILRYTQPRYIGSTLYTSISLSELKWVITVLVGNFCYRNKKKQWIQWIIPSLANLQPSKRSLRVAVYVRILLSS